MKRRRTLLAALCVASGAPLAAADAPWSVRVADSVMRQSPDPLRLDTAAAPRWEYTQGLVLKAILEVAERTGDERYWAYAKAYYDGMIEPDGRIKTYVRAEYNIDRINPGKPLFRLYEKTKDEKYRKAIEELRLQLREHPRTSEGGFWHKKRYPSQMWLDGLYMGAPFLAQYAAAFGEPAAFDDVIAQYVLMEKHARDDKTGLLYHGWDESRQQRWADPKTGRSASFWGRAMGWYAMGLVETLEFVPPSHARRSELVAILDRLAAAVTRVQDPRSGVWFQVLDQGERDGNYREASVSAMFAFALLKASRLGWIDSKYGEAGSSSTGCARSRGWAATPRASDIGTAASITTSGRRSGTTTRRPWAPSSSPAWRWRGPRPRLASPQRPIQPPSTTSTWPWTYADAGELRNTTAPTTSSGSPQRPAGMRSRIWRERSGSTRRASVLSVLM
jgi:unsaturated rhamnogalacturonyl hydrolase